MISVPVLVLVAGSVYVLFILLVAFSGVVLLDLFSSSLLCITLPTVAVHFWKPPEEETSKRKLWRDGGQGWLVSVLGKTPLATLILTLFF